MGMIHGELDNLKHEIHCCIREAKWNMRGIMNQASDAIAFLEDLENHIENLTKPREKENEESISDE